MSMLDLSDIRYISMIVTDTINRADSDSAMELMTYLRQQALLIDRCLADPRHHWNNISNQQEARRG